MNTREGGVSVFLGVVSKSTVYNYLTEPCKNEIVLTVFFFVKYISALTNLAYCAIMNKKIGAIFSELRGSAK